MYFNYTLFKLYVYANIFFIAQVWFSGRGQLVFWGPVSFGGASKFSNLLAPRATASTTLMSRPGNILCNIFYTISLGSISLCLDPLNKCVLPKESTEWFVKFINIFCNWPLVDSLYLEHFHGPPLTLKNRTIWLRWSMFLNLWTVFTMESIVLVSVLTSCAKLYDLGPLQDTYPAIRRPI